MRPEIAPGPHSRSHWRTIDLATAVPGGRWRSAFDAERRSLAASSGPPLLGRSLWVGSPSQPFRRSRRTGNHRSPALAGVDRSPGGGAEAPQVPEGRSGQSLMALAFAAFQTPAEAFVRRLRPPAPAAALPAFRLRALLRFHPVRRPSGAVSQRRLEPHRVSEFYLLFSDLRHDPQKSSRSRPLDAAPRIRVAQDGKSRVIHKQRRSGG
jgi:hypothetical protein